ncbi:SDR family NAD(P)-dependent oxidoreductase [Sphingobium sp.]|uniref:SDR family NAD(P)-dependent oxidoreductase n=1 Tax=Sphingobium sp. TaxID=1912891 RepID=UPI0028BD5DAB|nr:SDR family NAD(P)-dependent oxidoreductase [Sphingobium sp.]
MTSQLDFTGRVAIVTGSGSGLGRAHALELAKRGAKLIINDLGGSTRGVGSSSEPVDRVVAQIKAAGGEAVGNHDSVADRAGGKAIVEVAMDHFGRIDIVINNAGIIRTDRFEDMSEEDIRSVLDVHVMGGFNVTQPAYRHMRAAGYGRILFTGSGSGMFGHAWAANYGAAKGAIFGMTQVIALEGEQYGINCNLLLPVASGRFGDEMGSGFFETPRFAEDFHKVDLEWLGKRVDPNFASALAIWLVSEECTTTKGCFTSAGGRYAALHAALCDGWMSPDGTDAPSAEDIATHWGEINAAVSGQSPHNVYDEFVGIPQLQGQAMMGTATATMMPSRFAAGPKQS